MKESDWEFEVADADERPFSKELEQGFQDDLEFSMGAARPGDVTQFSTAAKTAPNKTDAAAEYNKKQVVNNSSAWLRKCLILQRTARGIPARYPTALSAANATPKNQRIYDRDK